MQKRTNSDGETRNTMQRLWKVAELEFNGPVPASPKNFEVHFFRDGHIELAMTERLSPPRLILQSNDNDTRRPGDTSTDPDCPVGFDPLEAYNNPTRIGAKRAVNP